MSRIPIRALVLDYGGVISYPQNSKHVDNIVQKLDLERDIFVQIYLSLRKNHDRGCINVEQFWLNVLAHFELEANIELLPFLIQEDTASWTIMNETMIQYIHKIKPKFYKLALLSNMTPHILEYLKMNYTWFDLFDVRVFSCDYGIIKPDRGIYQTCLEELDMPAADCLFVDDSPANVRGALESGMHAFQFKSYSQFSAEFNRRFSPIQTA